ncbi:PAS domain-containing protein [Hirsutella rhossiliensis]|uniref:PAS domain-containing protein n=1 Tax=Hirsutella rhossiliensis TaxID=111463 RepID=A0A9P8MWR2_9HYPO|nr:PAS domain-containing protein [Hirsutella rhossiliensis]KAH0961631.1 PAS domain-containing protein [Hirsutella rhossiliensis]
MTSKAPPPPPINSWETRALDYQFPGQTQPGPEEVGPQAARRQIQDPLVFPGLYSASGFDMMSILLRVRSRPNPQIELGAIDCSVSLVLCDLELPDTPIVYTSDSFCELTGYSKAEVLGLNCRFLQTPPANQTSATRPEANENKAVAQQIRQAVEARREIQVELVNYKKSGERFNNVLSVVPVEMDVAGYYYAVGFQVQID